MRQRGRYFQAHITVAALRTLILGQHQITCRLDVGNDQRFVQRLGRCVGGLQARDIVFVIGALADGVEKNRRVGGDAGHAIASNQFLQAAFLNQRARQVIEPNALAELFGLLYCVHDVLGSFLSSAPTVLIMRREMLIPGGRLGNSSAS